MAIHNPSQEWLDQVQEPTLDPDRAIVDPHHHLWNRGGWTYELKQLWRDTGSGHNITQTIFIECGANYFDEGPKHLKPVGETSYVVGFAEKSQAGQGSKISGIVAHADLTDPHLDEILDAHVETGKGYFRGIRHSIARAQHPESMSIAGKYQEGLSKSEDFCQGLRRLSERGFTYDCWLYHYQILEFRDMALAAPDTTMVFNHFGTPIGVGPYADNREEIFEQWKEDVAAVAECANVVAKLGGLAMPDNGFGWDLRDTPGTSDELLEAQARYYHHAIHCFGADRCMFESNFPVDRLSISYHTLWNALKKIAVDYSEEDKTAMFSGTATRIYKLID
ncbi:MAG: amidohydrolase [Opitutaceae bacterium]|nr:amidohydrolase [Opitutaceae bacterium]|tara:strand:- start:1025 stop:2029 length:1005 start_codon:yes stop_codon:yes gene_type:complete